MEAVYYSVWWPSSPTGYRKQQHRGGGRDYGQFRGLGRKMDGSSLPAIAPRFLFIFCSFFLWSKRNEGNSSGRAEWSDESNRARCPDLENPRASAAVQALGSAMLTKLPVHKHALSKCTSQAPGGARRWENCGTAEWSSTYDEAAVEVLLEVRADIGVGEEVRQDGGARKVLRPPRICW